MKPRGALQPTNFGTKQSKTPSSQGINGSSGAADLDNELFAAMQQWDDDNGVLGFVEEAGYEDCVMEGGADPEDVGGDNYEAGGGYQIVKHEKKSSSS